LQVKVRERGRNTIWRSLIPARTEIYDDDESTKYDYDVHADWVE
jgi:hypothetical protein